MKSWTFCYFAGFASALSVPSQFDPDSYTSENVLVRDVAVIGGGATGTYGAIGLTDMGKTVAVVEKREKFGGHVSTYFDEESGTPIDYGLQAYYNNSVAIDFFNRFDITLIPYPQSPAENVFIDFASNEVVQNVTMGFNFTAYTAELHKYPPFQYGWNLPHPIPEDLLLPFGDFIEKYSLQDIAYTVHFISEGDGSLLDELTLYVFQRLNDVLLEEVSGGDGFKTHNNSELYFKAAAELGSSALLESTVIAADRSTDDSGVRLVVDTPTGDKLIIASQLLVSAPIVMDNMAPFGLDDREEDLFEQIEATGYYTYLVNNTGLPSGYAYENAGVDTDYHIPDLPAVYNVRPTIVDGIFYGWYGSQQPVSEEDLKAEIIETIKMLSNDTAEPEFLAFSSHSPFKQMVSADAIRDGFYDDLNALQGYRNTWYTGNAFDQSGSSSLWNFTKQLLPDIADAVDTGSKKARFLH